MTEKPERIAKVIAAAGVCSRRDAERLIEAGRVSVNGKYLKTPAFTVTSEDEIVVDGRPLRPKKNLRLWLYHKPVGIVTTAKDPQGRPTVFDLLPKSMGRVISVGRLDLNSEGLLLLTNNGAFSRHLELPKNALPRHYRVRIYGHVEPDALKKLEKGITIDGIKYRSIDVVQEDRNSDSKNQWLQMMLQEGKNREIRKIMGALDLQVNRLIRTGYGPFELGNIPRGKAMEVSEKMLKTFCKNIGFQA